MKFRGNDIINILIIQREKSDVRRISFQQPTLNGNGIEKSMLPDNIVSCRRALCIIFSINT